jgi:hypothetical protein
MAVSESPLSPELVLFYTTALKSRPSYRRGILDCLSYPNGHVLQYSYRVSQIHPALRGESDLPRGSHGVIIYVDEISVDDATPKQYKYYPLRRVRLLRGLPANQGNTLIGRERVPIVLELHEFVGYADTHDPTQWDERVTPFDTLRNIRGTPPRPEFFVTRAADIFTKASVSDLSAWEDVVTNLAKSNNLASAPFINLEHPQDFDTRYPLALDKTSDTPRYDVLPGEVYRLNMAVYDGHGRETKLKLTSSSDDLIQVNQPFQSVVSGLAQKSALIACKRSIEKRLVALSIEVVDDSPLAPKGINSPNPTLLVRVAVPRWTVVKFFLLVASGAFFVSWDPDLIKETFCISDFKLVGLIVKGAGAILLAVAAWIGFRKLPSASV